MMNKLNKVSLLGASVSLVLAAQAHAIEGEGVDIGAGKLTPTLSITTESTDNWKADTSNRDSMITTIAPDFAYVVEKGASEFSLNLGLSREEISDESKASNTDYTLGAGANLEFSARSRLSLDLSKASDEDNSAASTDDSETLSYGATYGYGAESAKMQVELGVSNNETRYTQNLAAQNQKEFDEQAYNAELNYQITGATKAVVEYRYNDFDYISNNDLDSSAQTYLAGVKWDISGKTTGHAKLGRTKKDFDTAATADRSSSISEVGLTWNPLSYSRVSFDLAKSLGEGSATENSIDTTTASLGWAHSWSDLLYTDVSVTRTDEDYNAVVGTDNASRADKTLDYTLSATYKLRRWIDVTAGFTRSDLSSNKAGNAYDANSFYLGVVIGL